MLRQPFSRISHTGRIEPISDHTDASGADRSMDVLQYATACFAIAVAALLAVLR
ncbi:MAG: hypothetical protein ABI553_00235 [Chloroflexota bacterium]